MSVSDLNGVLIKLLQLKIVKELAQTKSKNLVTAIQHQESKGWWQEQGESAQNIYRIIDKDAWSTIQKNQFQDNKTKKVNRRENKNYTKRY